MKNLKKDLNIAGQSNIEVKKSQKHDANLQKNSTLYFQIGLILCLLGTYALFEMQFQKRVITLTEDTAQVEPITIDDYVKPFEVEVIKPKKPEPIPTTVLNDVFTPVEDDVPLIETIIKMPEDPITSDEPIANINDIYDGKNDPIEEIFVPFTLIEKVPVYPGCEKYNTNEERKKCMSEKVTNLINKKFDTDIGVHYGISGKQRIFTQFTIDKNGNVTDIKVRSPHSVLESEAKRVINKIPKMEPGLQRNQPVGVIYTLPIMYEARDY